MLSISSPSALLPFVRGATALQIISLIVMRNLYVAFDVSVNKLLNKPSYDITVMDDLALGVHHCLALTIVMLQCIWNNHADIHSSTPRRTDMIKEVTCQIYVCVYNKCWRNVLFSECYRLEIGGLDPLETCFGTGVLGFLPCMVVLNTSVRLDKNFVIDNSDTSDDVDLTISYGHLTSSLAFEP